MELLRIATFHDNGFESFIVHDLENLLKNLRNDPRVAKKYKQMSTEVFIEWVNEGITKKQFDKLKALNLYRSMEGA